VLVPRLKKSTILLNLLLSAAKSNVNSSHALVLVVLTVFSVEPVPLISL
jgi:hypothetical protein